MNGRIRTLTLEKTAERASIGTLPFLPHRSGPFVLRIHIFDGETPIPSSSFLDAHIEFCLPDRTVIKKAASIAEGCLLVEVGVLETLLAGTVECTLFLTTDSPPAQTVSFSFETDGPPEADALLFLPPSIYAAVGKPLELYGRQIYRSITPEDYEIYFHTPVGRNYARKWTYTPLPQDAPQKTVELQVRDRAGQIIDSAQATIHISSLTTPPDPKTLMMIGDSISTSSVSPHLYTAIRQYSRELVQSETDVLTMVGTKGTSPNQHEATSGSRIQSFLTETSANSFWDAESGRTNFAAYTARTGIRPDIVHLMLGTNNALNRESEDTASIEADADDLVTLLSYLRADWPSTLVLVGLPPLVCRQDGLESYRLNQAEYRQSRTDKVYQAYAAAFQQKLEEEFGGDDHLLIVPHIATLDREYGYGFLTVPANPFTTETVKIPEDMNHPREAGQRQMASQIVNAWAYLMERQSPGVTLTNIVSNPGFDGTGSWSVYDAYFTSSTQNGVLTQTGKAGVLRNNSLALQTNRSYTLDHLMYIRAVIQTDMGNDASFFSRRIQMGGSAVAQDTVKSTDFRTVSKIVAVTSSHISSPWFGVGCGLRSSEDLTGHTFSYKEPLCVDLTAAYGEGNEPDQAWCDENIPYFEGSITI